MPDEDLLKEITSASGSFGYIWAMEKNIIIMIKDILLYMNKNFVPKMKNYQTV
jgi:hypothetical protein